MNKIELLPKNIISRVAAGEVIEHPASVVKELIENAIDASATEIGIDIKNMGLSKIRVVDNGNGMSLENLNKCFLRHTTSKIKNLEDLENIKSLGFRGEALFSITSISKTSIKSKIREEISGNEVKLLFGEHLETLPVGMPTGTAVTVENVFDNLPARQKYYENKVLLKKYMQIVTEVGLAHPSIGFAFKNNDKLLLHLPKQQDIFTRVKYVLGDHIAKKLIPFEIKGLNFKIFGYISKPQESTYSSNLQYLFINNRAVNDKEISKLIKQSFGSLIDPKSNPTYVIYIEMPEYLVDVNIHPRKEHVFFVNENEVKQSLVSKVKELLGLQNLTYEVESEDVLGILNNKKSNKHLAKILKDNTNEWNIKTGAIKKELEEIIQVNKLYLITETPKGILVVDQHAAHERILYEEYLANFLQNNSKLVDVNIPFELPIANSNDLELKLEDLKNINIYIESFGKNSFIIRKIPKLLEKHKIQQLILELLETVDSSKKTQEVDTKSLETISYIACRSAIKAGDYLTFEERKNLLVKLSNTKTNYTCPHGRPVKMIISMPELARMFKRIK